MARDKIQLNRNESNSLCRRCVRLCRQPAAAVLVDCRRFQPLPFKIADPRFRQLDLFPEEK